VVYQPVENILYFASLGNGAFLVEANGEVLRLRVSEKTDFSAMNLAVSHNHRSPKMKLVKQRLGIVRETRRGSVGIKVGLVATRRCDLYIHLSNRTKYWDTCAPQIILEEAGGRFTDIFGGEYRYDLSDVQNHNGLIATNGVSHEAVIKGLKPLLTEFGRRRVVAG
jgi:3'(2'), 5'-bisphosphate nucleotidase